MNCLVKAKKRLRPNENGDSMSTNGENSNEKNSSRVGIKERGDRSVAVAKYTLDEFCICCGTVESLTTEHPLIKGRMCKSCTKWYKKNHFRLDNEDGVKFFCSICCDGGQLFICDNCVNVFCHDCVTLLDPKSFETISKINVWNCYMCQLQPSGLIQPDKNWENRLCKLLFKIENDDNIDFSLIPKYKPKIVVLSLFDGIGAAKVAMDLLNLDIEKYYSCEIDEDAINVTRVKHPNEMIYLSNVKKLTRAKLKEIGPIDLVIGGSPCNDLSIANPNRKGLYDSSGTGCLFFEFFRILGLVQKLNDKQRNTFWLFENVASIQPDALCDINRFLERRPALYNSVSFSAQNRLRFFWGNIPYMYSRTTPSTISSHHLQDILVPNCGRVAQVDKVRTITTRPNSLKQGGNKSGFPVKMNGKDDVLWPTEMEKLFGFPSNYTDVAGFSKTTRIKLIGQSWTVPVVQHILEPLKNFFKTK